MYAQARPGCPGGQPGGGGRLPAVDREYASHMDVNIWEGLALVIVLTLRLVPQGLLFIAAQCSSWVWIGRASTCRSGANPLGDSSRRLVAEGNELNCRTALLCTICSMNTAVWMIEQPVSSLFFDTRLMAATIMHLGAKRIHFWMRSFGHDSQKGTVCYGTPEWCHPNAPWLSQPASAERAGKSKPKASAKPKAKATPKMYEIKVNKMARGVSMAKHI